MSLEPITNAKPINHPSVISFYLGSLDGVSQQKIQEQARRRIKTNSAREVKNRQTVQDLSKSAKEHWREIYLILKDKHIDALQRFQYAFAQIRANYLDPRTIIRSYERGELYGFNSILTLAVSTGKHEVVDFVLDQLSTDERERLINYNKQVKPPLMTAAGTKSLEAASIISSLIKAGANLEIGYRNEGIETYAMHEAAKSGNLLALDIFSIAAPELIDQETGGYRNYTPIFSAIDFSKREVVDFLIKHGANLNYIDPKSGVSVLVHAINSGIENRWQDKIAIINKLSDGVVDIHYRHIDDESGHKEMTAIENATNKGYVDIVELLVQQGAELENSHLFKLKHLNFASQEDNRFYQALEKSQCSVLFPQNFIDAKLLLINKLKHEDLSYLNADDTKVKLSKDSLVKRKQQLNFSQIVVMLESLELFNGNFLITNKEKFNAKKHIKDLALEKYTIADVELAHRITRLITKQAHTHHAAKAEKENKKEKLKKIKLTLEALIRVVEGDKFSLSQEEYQDIKSLIEEEFDTQSQSGPTSNKAQEFLRIIKENRSSQSTTRKSLALNIRHGAFVQQQLNRLKILARHA